MQLWSTKTFSAKYIKSFTNLLTKMSVKKCCKTAITAAYRGHLKCVQVFHETGCSWDAWICGCAAQCGHLDCLQYARENGCDWDSGAPAYAALNGQLHCLRYAHENGCEWDYWTCAHAAVHGNLPCLRYAHQNGCEWGSTTTEYAVEYKQYECFKYAAKRGCPVRCEEATKMFVKLMMEDIIANICRNSAAITIQTEFRRRVSFNPHCAFGRRYLLRALEIKFT